MANLHLGRAILNGISRVAGKLVARLYPAQKLDSWLYFYISSSGQTCTYNVFSQEGTCFLEVLNLSPFDYTIDRLTLVAAFDYGQSMKCTLDMPEIVKAQSQKQICLRSKSPMDKEGARLIKEKAEKADIEIESNIICSIRSF